MFPLVQKVRPKLVGGLLQGGLLQEALLQEVLLQEVLLQEVLLQEVPPQVPVLLPPRRPLESVVW